MRKKNQVRTEPPIAISESQVHVHVSSAALRHTVTTT